MYINHHNRLRSPDERVGTLAHAALPPPASADADLVRALRARDEAAFESLVDHYYVPMLRIAAAYVRSREEAEEVVQDTWLAVLAGIDRFEERSSLKTWIFRILVNRARSRAKREARQLSFSSLPAMVRAGKGEEAGSDVMEWLPDHGALEWSGSPPSSADTRLDSDELFGRIEVAIDSLPPRQKEVITLRDVEGWSAAEVCDLLSLSEANQRVLLHRARMKVRDALTDYLEPIGPEITSGAGAKE